MIGNGIRCFGCDETGHRQSDRKKQGKKSLFINTDDCEDEDGCVGEEPVFDGIDTGGEDIFKGDTGPILMVYQMCLTPRANGDEWLRNNIFHSTCTILGKVCCFVIDSCENIVSTEAM